MAIQHIEQASSRPVLRSATKGVTSGRANAALWIILSHRCNACRSQCRFEHWLCVCLAHAFRREHTTHDFLQLPGEHEFLDVAQDLVTKPIPGRGDIFEGHRRQSAARRQLHFAVLVAQPPVSRLNDDLAPSKFHFIWLEYGSPKSLGPWVTQTPKVGDANPRMCFLMPYRSLLQRGPMEYRAEAWLGQ